MYRRYADADRLKELDIVVSPGGFAIFKSAHCCDNCGVPPAPSDPIDFALWLLYDAPQLGHGWRIAKSRARPEESLINYRAIPRAEIQSAIERSYLTLAIGIPDYLLVPMRTRLDEEELAFLGDEFVIAICDECRHSDLALHEDEMSIMERYERGLARVHRSTTNRERVRLSGSIRAWLRAELRYQKNTG